MSWCSPARSWRRADLRLQQLRADGRRPDAGAIAYRVAAVADDAETLRATIEDQLIRADIVVTSGASASVRTTS
ncbi:hypothetical protein NKH18_21665 [Streptomyces sp. M10(2022)]